MELSKRIKGWFTSSTGKEKLSDKSYELTRPVEDRPSIRMERHKGNTTRLADYYIQKLFDNQGEYVLIMDHFHNTTSDRELIKIITKRLQAEHKGVPYDVNFSTTSIKLL